MKISDVFRYGVLAAGIISSAAFYLSETGSELPRKAGEAAAGAWEETVLSYGEAAERAAQQAEAQAEERRDGAEDALRLKGLPSGAGTGASEAPAVPGGEQPGPQQDPQQGLININLAGKEELMRLRGIGSVRAEAIIAYREAHGGFSCPEDIMKVRGIGEKMFESIKGQITVREHL